MSKNETIRKRAGNASFIRESNRFGSHRNMVRINPQNSLEHEVEKFKVCYQLAKEGKEFYTEAITTFGLKADIFVLDTGIAIEIKKSENKESIEEKRKKYKEFGIELETIEI